MTKTKLFTVTFAGDFFVLISTPQEATDEDGAIESAITQLTEHYGWNVGECAFSIEAEEN